MTTRNEVIYALAHIQEFKNRLMRDVGEILCDVEWNDAKFQKYARSLSHEDLLMLATVLQTVKQPKLRSGLPFQNLRNGIVFLTTCCANWSRNWNPSKWPAHSAAEFQIGAGIPHKEEYVHSERACVPLFGL